MSETPDIVVRLRRMSVAVYLAAEEGPASDVSDGLKQAADHIEALRQQLADAWRELGKRDAEIKRLRQQLAEPRVLFTDLVDAYEKVRATEVRPLEEQLADAREALVTAMHDLGGEAWNEAHAALARLTPSTEGETK